MIVAWVVTTGLTAAALVAHVIDGTILRPRRPARVLDVLCGALTFELTIWAFGVLACWILA